MNRQGLTALVVILSWLTSCSQATGNENHTAMPTSPPTRATPYAAEPAAGICATFQGPWATLTLAQTMPDPRCLKVQPDQRLVVINQGNDVTTVTLASFSARLGPGERVVFDTPFGSYLAPGVHIIRASRYGGGGSDLWLSDP